MTDWVTISSLATAGGTLVLAVATFSSVRSANRSARVAEQSLMLGTKPVLVTSRDEDPVERVRFGDDTFLNVPGHGAALVEREGRIYMAIGLRNGGAGLALILGWRARTQAGEAARTGKPAVSRESAVARPDLTDFRHQQLDLMVPAGETGYWQGGLYDPDEPGYRDVADALRVGGGVIWVDLLFGDYQGGQLAVVRFGLSGWPGDGEDSARAFVLRYWPVGDDEWPD